MTTVMAHPADYHISSLSGHTYVEVSPNPRLPFISNLWERGGKWIIRVELEFGEIRPAEVCALRLHRGLWMKMDDPSPRPPTVRKHPGDERCNVASLHHMESIRNLILFNIYLDISVWSKSHSLTWRRRGFVTCPAQMTQELLCPPSLCCVYLFNYKLFECAT